MWVVQKYIERPLIIIGKKFDIRVWVLLTSVEPLTVWMWTKPYLRFTAQDYNSKELHNKFAHLTNASVSKSDKSQQVKKKGKYSIKQNMWDSESFQDYLANEYCDETECAFSEIVMPQLKQGVIDSILSGNEVFHHRDRSHELFGYDFMVDKDLNVWLIECNSSPSMSTATAVTEKLVPQMMETIVEIVLDNNNGHECS